MAASSRKPFYLLLILFPVFLSGCIDKTFFPPVTMEVTSVDPYRLLPTATDTASLPETSITIQSLSGIPCHLRSYTIAYKTSLGDPIESAAISVTPIELKLEANQSLTVSIKPYTSRIVDLYDLSISDISPIVAEITLNFKDVNDNWVSQVTHCLLEKP